MIKGATSGIGLAAAKVFAARSTNLGIIAGSESRAEEVSTVLRID